MHYCLLKRIHNFQMLFVCQESGTQDSHYHDKNLINCVTNLFAAGTDTTGTTIRWGLLFMAKYAHIQGIYQFKIHLIQLINTKVYTIYLKAVIDKPDK